MPWPLGGKWCHQQRKSKQSMLARHLVSNPCSEQKPMVHSLVAASYLEYTYNYASNTIDPDWDVIKQCAGMLTNLMNITALKHVKGHQYNNINYDVLDVPARLNADLDILAGTFRINYKHHTKEVLQLPVNTIQVNIGNAYL
eukprot:15342215-Ditylum_brightwellii.AAC.1